MAKVITTIAAENGMDIGDILSFKTKNYIGIWDNAEEKFALMCKFGAYFEPWYLDEYGSGFFYDLKSLDEVVYKKCEEHIAEVFDKSNYTIELN